MNSKSKSFNIRIPTKLADDLNKIAEKEGRSRNNLINYLLQKNVEKILKIESSSKKI